jgi:VanZ family protein
MFMEQIDSQSLKPASTREHLFRDIRNLILDYALGVSILGVIPVQGLLTLKLLLAALINIKMMWDVGQLWGFPKGQDILALAGNLFGFLGAIALGVMTWLSFVALGLFVRYVGSFSIAAALFTVTWMIGQATHQFYANGRSHSQGETR